MSLQLKSSFQHNSRIPVKFTCQGKDISPELTWSRVPEGTQSLALIMDDPDAPDPSAPKMTFVHWVLYNIPVNCSSLPENVSDSDLPQGTLHGKNNWNRTGYGGPCPPIGEHRYFFKLFALDTVLNDLNEPTAEQLQNQMQGHVLDQCELIGLYEK